MGNGAGQINQGLLSLLPDKKGKGSAMNTERQPVEKFNYFLGIITLGVIFCIVWFLWYVFMNPNTVFKLYTPMYGFSLVVMFLTIIVFLTHVIDYHAFLDHSSDQAVSIRRGIGFTLLAFVMMIVVYYLFFWGFIGKFGVAYFSPYSIVASGGIGAELFVARENASTAIIYLCAAFLWLALYWKVGFGSWPWHKLSAGVIAWSRFFAVSFFVILVYAVMFHPHVCYLFYPAQTKAGVEAWWTEMAGTGSAFFSLGLILCALMWVIYSDLLWEGYPWKMFEQNGKGNFGKGFVTFILTFTMGIVILYIMLQVMNYFWDEAFVGGQYTDGPDFRYIHAGEISGFLILAAFIWKNYFNNFPNKGGIWLRSVSRTAICFMVGMLIYWFYYSPLATFFLAKVEGFAQPGDTPLVWTMLFLSIILVQSEFFEGWPLNKQYTGDN